MKRVVACLVMFGVLTVSTTGTVWAKEDEAAAKNAAHAKLQALLLQFESNDTRTREQSAKSIAREHYAPDQLVPWLTKQLTSEKDFHVRLALAWALAEQGERRGLKILIDSLNVTGHLGWSYLRDVSGKRFGGSGEGWNRPAWDEWYTNLKADEWRENRRKVHALRFPVDADEAGLQRAIAWWKTTGLPDVSSIPMVKVTHASRVAGDDGPGDVVHGFVVSETPTHTTVFDVMMRRAKFPKQLPGSSRYPRIESLAIDREIAKPLARLEHSAKKTKNNPFMDFAFADFNRRRGFLIAMALYGRGQKQLALRIWKHVGSIDIRFHAGYGTWSVVEQLRSGVIHRLHTSWQHDLVREHKTWRESLKALEDLQRRMQVDYSQDVETLRAMAAEEVHYKLPDLGAVQGATLDPKTLVRALPNVQRWCVGKLFLSDRFTIHNRIVEGRQAPVTHLKRLGYEAVPALIEALEDTRFTRVAIQDRRWKTWHPFQFRVVRVNELAHALLEHIAGRKFVETPRIEFDVNIRRVDDTSPTPREIVEHWWKSAKKKGEAAVLIDGIRAGTSASVKQAERLALRFPKQALDPIRDAIAASKGPLRASALTRALAPIRTKEASALLRSLARKGDAAPRLAAAETLLARDDVSGLNAILPDWYTLASDTLTVSFVSLGPAKQGVEPRELIRFMCKADPQRSLRRMKESIEKASPALCAYVAREIAVRDNSEAPLSPETTPNHILFSDVFVPEQTSMLLEALLVQMLRDRRIITSHTGPSNMRHLDPKRVGDLAAKRLGLLWPNRYLYDETAYMASSLTTRYRFLNTWRKANNLEAVAVPTRPKPKPVSGQRVKAALQHWQRASDDKERSRAEGVLVRLGLGVIPVLRQVKAPTSSEAEQLDWLIRRLSCIVHDVHWETPGASPSDKLKQLTESLIGQPLRGKDVLSVLQHVAVNRTRVVAGVSIIASRDTDGTGVTLGLRLIEGQTSTVAGKGRWALRSGSGVEFVDDEFLKDTSSWWHEARAPQLDELMLAPIDRAWRIERTLLPGNQR